MKVMNLQFLSNEKGQKTAVVIPISDWEEIQQRLSREKFFNSLTRSVEEINLMKEGKLQEPDIADLFND